MKLDILREVAAFAASSSACVCFLRFFSYFFFTSFFIFIFFFGVVWFFVGQPKKAAQLSSPHCVAMR